LREQPYLLRQAPKRNVAEELKQLFRVRADSSWEAQRFVTTKQPQPTGLVDEGSCDAERQCPNGTAEAIGRLIDHHKKSGDAAAAEK